MFERSIVSTLVNRLNEPRQFMQFVIGPRQTGKSTAVEQALSKLNYDHISFAFDRPKDQSAQMLETVWQRARKLASQTKRPVILSLDEIQKVSKWSSFVKYLWDSDTKEKRDIKVIITGSSALNIQSGLAESLKGRFEIIFSPHWSYSECRAAFNYNFEDFLHFGGYPGAAPLIKDRNRWLSYIHDSIIEPTLTQDVLELEQVRKPALLRALFEVGAVYSAQEISYRKLLGQLDDKGNTETISHYVELLSHAGLMVGLKKYDDKIIEIKSSSPRLMVYDTSLMTSASEEHSERYKLDGAYRGHLIESAVGAYLLARSKIERFNIYWWRHRNAEVDFVLTKGRKRTAIEVKSGRIKSNKGFGEFLERYPNTYCLTVGSDVCSLESFLLGEVPVFQ